MPYDQKKEQLLCEGVPDIHKYYGMQDTFDNLYAASKNGEVFTHLMSIVLQRENILSHTGINQKNTGSKTYKTEYKFTIRGHWKVLP